MDTQKALYAYMRARGISIAFVAAKAGIAYELLRRSLKEERVMSADELVKVLSALGITLEELLQEKSKT